MPLRLVLLGLCLSSFGLDTPLRLSLEPTPPFWALPPHSQANRVSPLPSVWLNLLSVLSYSGSLPACPSLPAPPPPAEEGVSLCLGEGAKGFDFGLPTSCLVAAETEARLLAGQGVCVGT